MIRLTQMSGNSLWVRADEVIVVCDGSGGANVRADGQEYLVKEAAEEVVRKIEEARKNHGGCWLDRPLPPLSSMPAIRTEPVYPASGGMFSKVNCRHCGHSYHRDNRIIIVCGAMPICPSCGKTQMAWEGTR